MTKIDAKDASILSILSADARIKITDLAKKLRLSPTRVLYRIKRLEKSGVLIGYYPEIDYELLGFGDYTLYLSLEKMSLEKRNVALEKLKRCSKLLRLVICLGDIDVRINFVAKTDADSMQFVRDISEQLGFHQYNVSKRIRKIPLRNKVLSLINSDIRLEALKDEAKGDVKLDKKSVVLLKQLSLFPQDSYVSLARKMRMSAEAVKQRYLQLNERGILKKMNASIDYTKLGVEWWTLLIHCVPNENFENWLRKNTLTTNIIVQTGYWNYDITFNTSDSQQVDEYLTELKANIDMFDMRVFKIVHIAQSTKTAVAEIEKHMGFLGGVQ